ncbi:DUF4340 domain-containing protein [Baaleninema sp.]|uniref:DUF4340 domain-containing protein n=1 Tax=Baaleninema sp. TaxID=3101197 RepID=UPI003CFE2943
MRLKRSTQVLIPLAVILAGGLWLYDTVIVPQQEERQAQQNRAFSFDPEQVTNIQVTTEDYTIALTPLEEPVELRSPDGEEFTIANWEFTPLKDGEPQGEGTPATDAYVTFLLAALKNAEVDRSIVVKADEKAQYGLDTPFATVTFTLENGETHRLLVGNRDFTGSFVYAIADPAANEGESTVLLLPVNIENAVDRTLEDWKAEPPPNSSDSEEGQLEPPPTPQPSEGETTPEATPTPEATETEAETPSEPEATETEATETEAETPSEPEATETETDAEPTEEQPVSDTAPPAETNSETP